MSRNYHIERDGAIRRWYGGNPQPGNPRPNRIWAEDPITPADCLGIPVPVNLPFMPLGHCMAWKYNLNQDGYGYLTVGGRQEQAHRVVFIQTRGSIPDGKQVNHLCNRPYCVQPAHLYAGTKQDNKDDSRIFSDPDLITAPWVMHFPTARETGDPLVQRLQERGPSWNVEAWEPVEQPPQLPLEEFTCPGHDFALTMQGGDCRICRICEVSQWDEERAVGMGTFQLVADFCPASQTVVPIFEKIMRSEFVREGHLETRRRAYRRESQPFWIGDHELRNCRCPHCTQDRRTFRNTLDPLLTREESELLDICDRLQPRITDALHEASAAIMGTWARKLGMSDEQALVLREHLKDCRNTRTELSRTARVIESDLAYLLYALGRFQDRDEMLGDPGFRMVMFRLDTVRMRPQDHEHLFNTVIPAAGHTAERLTLAWEREADGLMRPHLEKKPTLREDTKFLARMLAKKHVFEHLRFEFLGRNSSTEQRPHPHSGCAVTIRETGRADPFPMEFQEGTGYTHQHA